MNIELMATHLQKTSNVFRNPNFLKIFFGKIISQLGDQIFIFAWSWYILALTKSSLQMSIFLIVNTIVYTMVAPFGGMIADRFNRQKIMIWMDAIRWAVLIVVAFLLYRNMIQLWMLYVNIIILSACGGIFSPAAGAVIPNIVTEEQLAQASSLDQFIWSFCAAMGMLISGVLYKWVGLIAIFLFNSFSFFISAALAACLKLPGKTQNIMSDKRSFRWDLRKPVREIKEGYQYVKNNKLVFRFLLMNALISLTIVSAGLVFFSYIFNIILKATPFQFAVSQASAWTGIVIGSLLVPLFLHRYRLKDAIFGGLLTCSLVSFLLMLVFLPQIKPVFSIWGITVFISMAGFVNGMACSFFIIPVNFIFQKYTSDEYRGRFWGFQASVTTLASAIGFLLGGVLAQRVWISLLFLGLSIIIFLIDLWISNLQELKDLS